MDTKAMTKSTPPPKQAILKQMRNKLYFFLIVTFALENLPSMQAKEDAAPQKITQGKVIVPFKEMRRIWGELLSIDPETRKGKFQAEHNDEVFEFCAMPYAEMLHHAANGDITDFKIGERAIFRLHPDKDGKWYWLTYIQDEMNMLNGHKEYYHVQALDPAKGTITFMHANPDKSLIRWEGVVMHTNPETQFWKAGKLASYKDLKVGDMFRAKTKGMGCGRTCIAWHVFLDDESLLKFRDEQEAIHASNMARYGLTGYLDEVGGGELALTLFRETREFASKLKAGQKVKVAPASFDRKPKAEPVEAKILSVKPKGVLHEVRLRTEASLENFKVADVSRLWAGQ
jgi:hypothetical protein